VHVIGRYQIVKRLGQGGMAEVFLARQEGPHGYQKTVVVKRLLAHLAENKRYVEMFLREARLAAKVNHPNVVQLFELGQDVDERWFLAMEYIDGLTLHRLAKRAWGKGRALPTEVIVRAIADAALGLHHAHTLVDENGWKTGLVHRDISPDNLMMRSDGVTKILDFGIAKGVEASPGVTKTGELKGKIPYMSPEQIQGHDLDGRTDLFSLGITFYWLLTGKRPFDGATEVLTLKKIIDDNAKPPSSVNDKVPPALDRIVMKLIEKDPAKRTATGLELHDKLVRLLGDSSRAPSAALIAELADEPDVEDETDPHRHKGPKTGQIASMPISATFAPTTVTQSAIRSRGALLGVTAAAVVAAASAIGLLVLTRPASAAIVVDAGAPIAAAAPLASTQESPGSSAHASPSIAPTPAPTPAAVVDAGSTSEPEPAVAPAEPATAPRSTSRAVTLTGPSTVKFRAKGAPDHGGGVVQLRSGVKSVVAFDTVHNSTHAVPIVNEVADYASLGTGTLIVRAVPFAQVSVGKEDCGSTPPPKPITLVPGEYVVKLVWNGVVKNAKVVVEKNKTAELRIKMNE
jgi:serine/threonine-protein kinase